MFRVSKWKKFRRRAETLFYGEFRANFKTSIFKTKLSFLRENHKNDNLGESPDFSEFTLYMIFASFLKMAISIMAIFSKIFENQV